MKKFVAVLFIFTFLVSACGPVQIFGPTLTPTSTRTSTPTISPTATLTLTPTQRPTSTPSNTPTSLPDLNVRAADIVNKFSDLFTFSDIPDVDGEPAQTGVSEEGFSTITLIGAPYVKTAELQIDLSRENSFLATAWWILFLEVTSRGGKEAADWVHDNFRTAVNNGKVEKIFGNANVILESNASGSLFRLIVSPAKRQ